jgi:predicted MFS family arabinose efflux permease
MLSPSCKKIADKWGRKKSIFTCLATASLGNAIMFISGMGSVSPSGALATMFVGRVVMGLGVGGIDAVVSNSQCVPVTHSLCPRGDIDGRLHSETLKYIKTLISTRDH